MARIFGRIFGFSDLSGLSPDLGLAIGLYIRNTHLVLANTWATVLELIHGPISRHFWFTWWPDLWPDFRFVGFLGFECSFGPGDRGMRS